MALEENPCADWSCRLFVAARTQFILVSNTLSLYSCVMPAHTITTHEILVGEVLSQIGERMKADQQQHAFERLVAPTGDRVNFAKPWGRPVSASMSDHVYASKLYLSDGLAPHEVGPRLNNARLPQLTDANGHRPAAPRDVFARFVSNVQDES